MAMEDRNMLAADCVVISCCCQCLILQIIFFVLLKLPWKLIRKAKEYAKMKIRRTRKQEIIIKTMKGRYEDEFLQCHGGSELTIQVESSGLRCCLEEVEKVLEEFSEKGEFAFGSFWGREKSSSSSTNLAQQEFEISNRFVQFEFVEIAASLSCSFRS
ncbi:uncharacterized protein LOC116132095 [Pistacia vera]|uniref:uncharacterized protein LOC116132095 n=1 Tax=Pistacia vera TaxID=55513 RepID=UPI001262C2A4|nr:uncharacterized protein LOC116132095 [Pistacia vera]